MPPRVVQVQSSSLARFHKTKRKKLNSYNHLSPLSLSLFLLLFHTHYSLFVNVCVSFFLALLNRFNITQIFFVRFRCFSQFFTGEKIENALKISVIDKETAHNREVWEPTKEERVERGNEEEYNLNRAT